MKERAQANRHGARQTGPLTRFTQHQPEATARHIASRPCSFGPCRIDASRRVPRPAIAHNTPSPAQQHLLGVDQLLNYLSDSYSNSCRHTKLNKLKKELRHPFMNHLAYEGVTTMYLEFDQGTR